MKRIVVMAGSFDIYSILMIAVSSPDVEYQEVWQKLQSRLEQDFGKGVFLVRNSSQEYSISVERVEVESV